MQAIITKYLGPTNTRGSRIKATSASGSITLGYNHALNSEKNHMAAAKALQAKFKWERFGPLVQGGAPDDKGYCFVVGIEQSAHNEALRALRKSLDLLHRIETDSPDSLKDHQHWLADIRNIAKEFIND